MCAYLRACVRGVTLDQQARGVQHLSLVAVGTAGVGPAVVPGDGQDRHAAVVDLGSRQNARCQNHLLSQRGIDPYGFFWGRYRYRFFVHFLGPIFGADTTFDPSNDIIK